MKMTSFLLVLISITTGGVLSQTHSQMGSDTLVSPVQLTAEQDLKQMMALLKIDSLRPGPSGNPSAPNAANSDESKANPYPDLPDPLKLNDGRTITTAEMWWTLRRPEIKEYFDREVYGRVPNGVPKVTWEVVSTFADTNADTPAITKKILGHVHNVSCPLIRVDIDLALTVPGNAKGPVPVMMEFGFRFPPGFKMTDQMKRLVDSMSNWQRLVLAKGWGYVIIIPTSYQEDNGKGLTNGLIGLVNKGQPRKADDWGALRAWAWGASRALDYLETDQSVDSKKVGIEGLSRYGKAALVTMAYEFWRASREYFFERGIPLDGRQLSEICWSSDC